MVRLLRHVFPAGLLMLSAITNLHAGVCQHVTDGTFTSPLEWTCPTVSFNTFAATPAGGGADLYADQGGPGNNTLYLMYDYWAGTAPSQFFDVFFLVPPDGTAYLSRITGANVDTYERPLASAAPILPNGAFDVGPTSGWSLLLPGDPDLILARFQGAVGFGVSPGHAIPHPMAEFQLSINRTANPAGGGGDGLYSPDPAFWGASEKSTGGADPPISSGIFTLNPDGSTDILPLISGTTGAPFQQVTDLPEPGSFFLLAPGAMMLLGLRRFARG